MFWKAVVVGLWGAFAGWWATYRARRREHGLQLRYSKRRDRYEAFDWTEVAERLVIYARNIILGVTAVWILFLLYLRFTDQDEQVIDLFIWLGIFTVG